MTKTKMRSLIVTTLLGIGLITLAVACTGGPYQVIGNYDATKQSFNGVVIQNNGNGTCPSLPASFQESDLVGTWHTYWNETGMMTITIKADGTFKQIHDYPPFNYHYEGDWHTWKLERREDGSSYVHFDGMQFCGRDCSQSHGGTWYDSCSHRMITMNNDEVVLILANVLTDTFSLPPQLAAPRGIEMYEPVLDPDTSHTVYQLEH